MFKITRISNKESQYGDFFQVNTSSGILCRVETCVSNCCAVLSISSISTSDTTATEFLTLLEENEFSSLRNWGPSQAIFVLPKNIGNNPWTTHPKIKTVWTFDSHTNSYPLIMYSLPIQKRD